MAKAVMSSEPCPKCMENDGLEGMVYADKFGLFCIIADCGWKRDWNEDEQREADEYFKEDK